MKTCHWTTIAVAAWGLLGACAITTNYDGTAFRCDEEPLCPPGYVCGSDGVCVRPGSELGDAAPEPPDAATELPDAAVPGLDAAPRPDASPLDAATGLPDASPPPIVTLSFGETDADDVRGVTSDTSVRFDRRDNNYGARKVLFMDADPYMGALVRFDISAIPVGSEVLAAGFIAWTTADELENGSIQVFEVSEAWVEGDVSGLPGAANYDLRTPTTGWTTAGVGPGSRGTVVLAEFAPDTIDARWEIELPTTAVQGWVDDPTTNHGLFFLSASPEGRGASFHSRESDEVARRPRLQVTFRAPPP